MEVHSVSYSEWKLPRFCTNVHLILLDSWHVQDQTHTSQVTQPGWSAIVCSQPVPVSHQQVINLCSFPFLSHLSQRFPKFCITHQNVDKSLQLHVSICKVNHHVWSGSSFGFCGSSYFFIIQSSFSYVFPMISWWFTMISLWFSHSFHVSRLRRLRHDILLWTAMMPLVTDGGMNL